MNKFLAIDSDGVIMDFNGSCERKFGGHPHHLRFECPERGLLKGDKALWAYVENDPDFWVDMVPFDHAHEMIEYARSVSSDVAILTGCPETGYERAAKHKTELLGDLFKIPVITCRAKDKPLHIKAPGDILVDDFSRNIKRWREAGGVGVLFKDWPQAKAELEAILGITNAL